MQKIIITYFIVFLFATGCRSNSGQPKESKFSSNSIDTLFTSNFFWSYYITNDENIYLIKEENKFYEFNRDTFIYKGQLRSDVSPEFFYLSSNHVIFAKGDENELELLFFKLPDLSIDYTINKVLISSYISSNNQMIICNANNKDTCFLFDLASKSKKMLLDKNLHYIWDNNYIYTYDSYFKNKKDKEKLQIIRFNRSSNRRDTLSINHENNKVVIFIFNDRYLAVDGEKLFMIKLNGTILKEWSLAVKYNYQILIKDNHIVFYNWLDTDNEELDKYYFIRQIIDYGEVADTSYRFKSPIKIE